MLDILKKYENNGLVVSQKHPTLPLTIWNYTPKTQYESLWDDITLQTRGLVIDNKGNVVARPFKKFFNLSENKHTPTDDFEVYDKVDGSLGILFNYNGEWIMSTRGSFTSEQSVKGFELLQKYDYNKLNKNYTYLFEIIYTENKIVLEYDFDDLVLLGIINTEDGYEFDIHSTYNTKLFNTIKNLGFRVVEKFNGVNDYNLLKDKIPNNKEGFVVKFSNGDRIKIKGEEYLKLHKIITNLSTTAVWEVLSNGGDFQDLLKDIPDEFYEKIQYYTSSLKYSFYQIREDAGKRFDYFMYGKYNDKEPIQDKKEYAIWVLKQPQHLQPILFRMFDKKEYFSYIWKLIKPEFKKL